MQKFTRKKNSGRRVECVGGIRISLEPLSAKEGEIVKAQGWAPQTNSVHVEYGLECYNVHDGAGNSCGKLTVQGGVSASGNAIIKQVSWMESLVLRR